MSVEPMLYVDEQAARPVCFCPRCAGECYAREGMCLRCGRAAV